MLAGHSYKADDFVFNFQQGVANGFFSKAFLPVVYASRFPSSDPQVCGQQSRNEAEIDRRWQARP